MPDSQQQTFQVSAYTDPVIVRVKGKANYLNCNSFREFLDTMLESGKERFVVDFNECTGMDSTFLGILAGTALKLRNYDPPGRLLLCNLNQRNHELICNLGLQNILTIGDDLPAGTEEADEAQNTELENTEVADAKKICEAHENLIHADQRNAAKFQDVVAFLRNQVEQEQGEQES
ncbi:MAG: STAS domain-containing protein [Opitutales bacterium]